MLSAQLLINLELLLRLFLLAGADIGLAEAIVGIGQFRIQLQRALVLGDGFREFALVRR